MVETLFEDIFRVDTIDPDGKKFDRGTIHWISSFSTLIVLSLCSMYFVVLAENFVILGFMNIVDAEM